MFDALMSEVKSQYRQLGHDPAVRKAVADEEAAEKKQLESEAREETRRIEDAKQNAPGTVLVSGSATATGGMYGVQIIVDGEVVREVGGGESLKLRLWPGAHVIGVSGGGMSRSLRVKVSLNDKVKLEAYFNNWGILGGGLNFKEV